MKFLYALSLVSILFFFSCDQGSDINSPVNIDNHSYEMIQLPTDKTGSTDKNFLSVIKTINGDTGGEIKLKESYVAKDGDTVKVDINLTVKENSFTGNVEIIITVDDEFAAASFSPAMVFDKPLELNMKFEGIDLENADYEFVFIDDDGTIELVDYNNLHVNEYKGKIWVNKAELYHFSRYGFVNRKL